MDVLLFTYNGFLVTFDCFSQVLLLAHGALRRGGAAIRQTAVEKNVHAMQKQRVGATQMNPKRLSRHITRNARLPQRTCGCVLRTQLGSGLGKGGGGQGLGQPFGVDDAHL